MLRRMRLLLSFDMKTVLLFIEAYVCLGWARCLLFLPFARVAPSLGEYLHETKQEELAANRASIKQITQVIHISSRYTFWESKCLVRAIASLKMLERRRIESTLYLGTTRDEKNGELKAHAWLRSGPYFVTGADVMDQYTVVGKFAKKISV